MREERNSINHRHPLLAAAFELLVLGTYYGGRSWVALLIVVLGGFAYVLFDGAAASADGASAVAPSAVGRLTFTLFK